MHHAAYRVLTGAAVAIALCAAPRLAAAQASAGATGAPAPATAAMTAAQRHDWERAHRMSKIIGTDVRTRSGDKIGDIKDVIVDDAGNVKLAIVSTGGFLGLGDTMHAVPWEALSLGTRDDRVVDIDKSHLKDAPHFTSRTWPNLGDEKWLADNRRFYIH
jgi:sporulation protein YlmC with PRC-barrel domain